MNTLDAPYVSDRFDRIDDPKPVDEAALASFLAAAQLVVDQERNAKFPRLSRAVLSADPGRKYVRIVIDAGEGQRSVYGFVDMTNGNVLKAETWKKPAVHARGNVHEPASLIACLTPYGIAYLR